MRSSSSDNTMSYCFNHLGINVNLAIGLSSGFFGLIILTGVPLCIIIGTYCLCERKNCPARTHVAATNPSAETTTAVTSNRTEISTATPLPYPQEPVYKDAQFSSQDAPPSYSDALALPRAAQVMV